MACDKPNGDCTDVSPCGSGCSGCTGTGNGGTPVLPKCQDVSLVPGVYQNATIVVNAAGCIAQVLAGEPEVYTPDECCGGTPSTTPTTTVRGDKGDPGNAATIAVDPNVVTGNGSSWSVENTGTPSAAVFRFTSPAPYTPPTPSGGTSGSVSGLVVSGGQVTSLPPLLLTGVVAEAGGAYASNITFTAAPASASDPSVYRLSINLDSFAAAILSNTGVTGLGTRVTAVENALASVPSSVYQVAAATGVNLIDPTGTVVPTAKIPGLSTNTWKIGVAYAGSNVAASDGTTVATVDALGRVTLPALTYPTDLV